MNPGLVNKLNTAYSLFSALFYRSISAAQSTYMYAWPLHALPEIRHTRVHFFTLNYTQFTNIHFIILEFAFIVVQCRGVAFCCIPPHCDCITHLFFQEQDFFPSVLLDQSPVILKAFILLALCSISVPTCPILRFIAHRALAQFKIAALRYQRAQTCPGPKLS